MTTISSLPVFDVYIAFDPNYGSTPLLAANTQALPASGMSNAYWTNCSAYLRDLTTNSGKLHYLDRSETGTITLTMDGRDGFFLNGGASPGNGTGFVIQSRLPIAVTATWSATTYPVFWGLIDQATEVISDQVNVDIKIQASDLMKQLSLKYMASTAFWEGYAQSAHATHWYRCTPKSTAIVTAAVASGGTATFQAINQLPGGGASVTISGLGIETAGTNGLALNFTHVLATPTGSLGGGYYRSFTVSVAAAYNGAVSSGTGSMYRTAEQDLIGSASGQYNGVVSFQQNGAMVYDANGCVDVCNGGSTPTGNIAIPETGSITAGGIDFWILGQGMAAAAGNPTGYSTVALLDPSQSLGMFVKGNGDFAVGTASGAAVSSVKVDDGYWHHVGVVLSGGSLHGYVDGATFALSDSLSSFTLTNSAPDYDNSVIGVFGKLLDPAPMYVDEIVVSSTSVTLNEVKNRWTAGRLLQNPTNPTQGSVLSGDRIAHVLCLAGFGTIVAGAVTLNSNIYFINDGSAWVEGTSGNGFIDVEPYYWDTPVTGSTALDLIGQITDSDIGNFFQKPDGTFAFYNQLYYGTWTWSGSSGSWAPNSYSPTDAFVWSDTVTPTQLAAGQCPYWGPSLQVMRDDADTWTLVTVTPQAGIDQVYENVAAEERWGYATLTKASTVHPNLNLALSTANFLGYIFASPLPRVQAVELRSETNNGSCLPGMLGAALGHVVEFKRTAPNASTTGTYPTEMGQIDQNMTIESLAFDFMAEPGYLHLTAMLDPYPIRT